MINEKTNNSYDWHEFGSFDNEKELIKEIQKGNARAFKNLMKKYVRELVSFAFHYLKSSDAAKDVTQDVFANIWEKRTSWNPTKSLRMYLYQAVKNEALKTLRNKKTERKYMKAYISEKKGSVVIPQKPDESDDFKQAVRRAIQNLPERAHMVYKLHRRDGLTYKEIALVMGISHKTVESQMSRALRILRKRLASYLPGLAWFLLLEQILH